MNDIEKYEGLIAELERKRAACVQRGTELSDERASVALDAHIGDSKAAKRLTEIHAALAVHGSELASLDAAAKAATAKLAAAQAAEARAVDRQRAEEARKLISELGACFPYLARKLEEAANALIAIDGGFADLRKLGFASPPTDMLRLNICAVLQTWAMRLPKHIHNELRDGFRFLAPHERKTAVQYWAQVQASLDNQINQRLDKTEQPNKERAA
jgi:hypothetical protein